MVVTKKKSIVEELRTLALQIESYEAQVTNTFDVERKVQLRALIKARWVMVDYWLDKYNEAALDKH